MLKLFFVGIFALSFSCKSTNSRLAAEETSVEEDNSRISVYRISEAIKERTTANRVKVECYTYRDGIRIDLPEVQEAMFGAQTVDITLYKGNDQTAGRCTTVILSEGKLELSNCVYRSSDGQTIAPVIIKNIYGLENSGRLSIQF